MPEISNNIAEDGNPPSEILIEIGQFCFEPIKSAFIEQPAHFSVISAFKLCTLKERLLFRLFVFSVNKQEILRDSSDKLVFIQFCSAGKSLIVVSVTVAESHLFFILDMAKAK